VNAIRLLSLFVGRSWDRFATRTHLRELPAVPTVAGVLALGLAIPLFADIKTTPAALTESLALQRLENFCARNAPTELAARPAGVTLDPRPSLSWEPIKKAKTYAVSLLGAADRVIFRASGLVNPACTLPEKITLEPGPYRIQVTGRTEDGGEADRHTGHFEVLAAFPVGELISPRPACRWLPVLGAVRYRVRLTNGTGQIVADKETVDAAFSIRAPANLDPAQYRLEAVGIDASGKELPYPRVSEFTVRAASQEQADLMQAMQLELDGVAGDLVKAGYYAENGSRYDVLSALAPYLRGADEESAGAVVARKVLALHGLK